MAVHMGVGVESALLDYHLHELVGQILVGLFHGVRSLFLREVVT